MTALTSVVVVVPARDEELVLPDCLRSLERAVGALHAVRPHVAVTVLVVLDRCTDGSAEVVARHPWVRSLDSSAGRVGTARAGGAADALRDATDPREVWLASTDADSVVPPHWLTAQVELAEGGADLVLGTVEPELVDDGLLGRWRQRHRLGEGHPHVHGANLGVRASRYLEVGGFPAVALHEDVLLSEAVKATGAAWVATDATRVRTSGRLDGRARGGFGTYLRDLAAESDPAVVVP
ncbi:glycosyltransferase family 2 protein [Phycicoccus sp. Root563]|uniref:glycosyltransferase n=1 Tax=Phycicoccus sp. Root563 TaxID=1736562 RepID=UPI000A62647C|nr:glycosyltransferase [Phycicoccus sp. Root563]